MIRVINLFLPAVSLLLLFNACSSSTGKTTSSSPTGKYKFTMYDSTGINLLDGEMDISKVDTSYTIGISITQKNNDFYSYGNMQSAKNYSYYNNKEKALFINMNPSSTDDNIYITLNYTGKSLTGKWNHTTIAGEKGNGKFIAERIK